MRQSLGWGAKVQTSIFCEVIKRMQAFGLIKMQVERTKITDNVHLQLGIYKDDIANGFKDKDYVHKVAASFQLLGDLFQGTEDALNLQEN